MKKNMHDCKLLKATLNMLPLLAPLKAPVGLDAMPAVMYKLGRKRNDARREFIKTHTHDTIIPFIW